MNEHCVKVIVGERIKITVTTNVMLRITHTKWLS